MPFDIHRRTHAHQVKLLGLTAQGQLQLLAAHVYFSAAGNQYILGVEHKALRLRQAVREIKPGRAAANSRPPIVLREKQSNACQVYARQLRESRANISMGYDGDDTAVASAIRLCTESPFTAHHRAGLQHAAERRPMGPRMSRIAQG